LQCYDAELSKDYSLHGTIIVHFTIQSDGSVSKSGIKKTTMNNIVVEKCVAHIIKNIPFPALIAGDIVIVNYPFEFKSTP